MEYRTIILRIPTWAIMPLKYDEWEGISETEKTAIDKLFERHPGLIIPCPNEGQEEFFSPWNDLDGLPAAGTVYDLQCLVLDEIRGKP